MSSTLYGKVLGLGVTKVLALHIRPEFLEDLRKRIDGHLRTESRDVTSQATLARIVRVPDRSGNRVSAHLREIEGPVALVAFRDKDAAGGVTRPRPNPSMAPPEIPGILMQQGRHHRLGHEVSHQLIGYRSAQPLAVALPTRSQPLMRTHRLAQARQACRQDKNRIVGGI